MVRPNSFTSAFVPFVDATLPTALSAAFAASRIAAILASLSCGGGGVGAAAAAVVSRPAIVSAGLFSPLEHAVHNAHTPTIATARATRIMVPPRSSQFASADAEGEP